MENEAKKEQMPPKEDGTPQKATYEQLNNYCTQLYNQNRQLVEKLQQLNMSNLFRRLDYLFIVIQNKEAFDGEFYAECVAEIKEALTLPKEEGNTEAKGTGKE